jgi:hypothetical protein
MMPLSGVGLPHSNKSRAGQNGGFIYMVAGEMLKTGYSPDEIGKCGGNFCRLFTKATAARS